MYGAVGEASTRWADIFDGPFDPLGMEDAGFFKETFLKDFLADYDAATFSDWKSIEKFCGLACEVEEWLWAYRGLE